MIAIYHDDKKESTTSEVYLPPTQVEFFIFYLEAPLFLLYSLMSRALSGCNLTLPCCVVHFILVFIHYDHRIRWLRVNITATGIYDGVAMSSSKKEIQEV